MAILDENIDKMSGTEFRKAINENALDLKAEEQTISGNLKIEGKLSLNQALIINDTIGTSKNIIIQANNISTNINNKKITFTETNYNSEIGNIFSNGFGMKINENFTINNTSSNVSTTTQLNGGNLFIRMNVENTRQLDIGQLGEKVIGFGNTSDPWVLDTNGLVLTSVTYPDQNLQGDISTYSSIYLNPPKKSSWSSTNNHYNNLEKTLMLARRGTGTTTGDIDSDNKNYYIWGDHNPYFHPASTGKSSGGIWIEYDNSSAGYLSDIGVKGHQGVLTDIGNQDANAICLRSINKGQDYYTGNANYSTLYVLSPVNAKGVNIPLQNRLKFQSGSSQMYKIYGDHNPNIQSPSGNLKFLYNGNTPDFKENIGEKGIQMIGTDMTNPLVNDLYLKSVNKGVTEEKGFNSTNSTTLFIQSPQRTDGTVVQLKDRLMLQSGTDTMYKIYGDHNPNIQNPSGNLNLRYNEYTPDFKENIGEKGIQMIGTDISSKTANNLYLRSVNKGVTEVNVTSANSTKLLIQSPQRTDDMDVQLKDRLMLQSGTDAMYKIYGEHNMKVVFYRAFSDTRRVNFKEIGVDFVPNIIECEKIDEEAYERKTVAIYNSGDNDYDLYHFTYTDSYKALSNCHVDYLTLKDSGKYLIKFFA